MKHQDFSIKLVKCLAQTEKEETKLSAMIELSRINNVLLPQGKPDHLIIVKFKTIKQQIEELGRQVVFSTIVLLIRSFCSSFNLVRNMSEMQMIECTTNLLLKYENSNYRIEDFVQFFQGAKMGLYGKVYDHMDTNVIFEMLEQFDIQRYEAGELKMKDLFDEKDRDFAKFDQRSEQTEVSRALSRLSGTFSIVKTEIKNHE